MLTPDQLRNAYLEVFKERHHAIVPSSSLVPENDPTTLFTGSGMQPMVPYLLGEPHPEGKRIVDSQKCFRSQDIEEVGDNRHTTYFEMLGNWSLGDYFKEEQLAWLFEFLTDVVCLDPNRLYVTVFAGSPQLGIDKDEKSVKIWQTLFAKKKVGAEVREDAVTLGMQDGRIFYYDETKNWWSRAGVPANMPPGEPGGPDSEVFFDFGEELRLHENSQWKDQLCHVNCDCGRFGEIGNSVFMQFQKQPDGSFTELGNMNVDFGGGLERILSAHENQVDVFKTQSFLPIILKLEEVSGALYDSTEETRRSYRVIADHLRAAVMLASDGVYPSNKEQGYFARRLVRRSIRFAKMIGIDKPFIAEVVPVIAESYQRQYPEVAARLSTIIDILRSEEHKFQKTLERGLRELEKVTVLSGETAFRLYETYGFPFELTQEIAQEKGQDISLHQFNEAKNAHAEASRSASAGKFKGGLQDQSEQTTRYHTATHLLHAALRQVLGKHVQQKGSNITAERLRFDFTHDQPLSDSEKKLVEQQINDWINQDMPVTCQILPKENALAAGALAFFGEKYPDQVSVYTIGDDSETSWISKELCGGPHVNRTSEIGRVELFKEKAVSQGVRRVYLK